MTNKDLISRRSLTIEDMGTDKSRADGFFKVLVKTNVLRRDPYNTCLKCGHHWDDMLTRRCCVCHPAG